MKKLNLIFLLTSLLFLAFGCATTKDVMPGENGVHRVSLKASDDEQGRHMAISEAKEYCKKQDKEAVFVNDKTEYKGSMDENTKKTIKKASNAAILVGGMSNAGSWSRGDTKNDTGNVIGGAGAVGHVMTDDKDYQVDMQFKCK